MGEILAFDPDRRTNAQAIRDCAALGYLRPDDRVVDFTYGLGQFWSLWKPNELVAHDLDPAKAPNGALDVLEAPSYYGYASFDVAVFDPPYKLNGTPTPGVDNRYGVGVVASKSERMRLILDGSVAAAQVARRVLLVKVQDQVSAGRKVWQTHIVAGHLSGVAALVDMLHVSSYRPQPAGRAQRTVRQNFSTLMIFAKSSAVDPSGPQRAGAGLSTPSTSARPAPTISTNKETN